MKSEAGWRGKFNLSYSHQPPPPLHPPPLPLQNRPENVELLEDDDEDEGMGEIEEVGRGNETRMIKRVRKRKKMMI